jgi:NADH dehydrogenase [ubiquinone] 1 alpha subcomplex assembly factor 1
MANTTMHTIVGGVRRRLKRPRATKLSADEDVLALMSSYGVLRGNISSEIPTGRQSALARSGFAGMRTKPLVATLTNPDPVMDFDAFDALSYRVRGDGRAYIASLRTENWLTDDTSRDVWQCAFQPPAGEWVDVVIPIDAFTQTYRGRAIHDHARMSANRVVYAGISVAGSVETDLDARRRSDGAFRLDVHSVVGLRMSEDEMEAHASRRRSHVEHPCGGFALLALECATDQSSGWLSRDKDEDDVEY